MREWIGHAWRWLLGPSAAFASFAERPPFTASILILALYGALTALTGFHPTLTSGSRYGQDPYGELPVSDVIFLCIPVVLTLFLWGTLLTWWLTRRLGERATFESVLATLTFAWLPWLPGALLYPLACRSWLAYRLEQALVVSLLVYSTILIGSALQVTCRMPRWKASVAMLPMAGLLWFLGLWTLASAPAPFAVAYPFELVTGHGIVVYSPKGRSRRETQGILRLGERTLQRICQALEVKPPRFPITIYLFPDEATHRRIAGASEDPGETDYAFHDCITLPYDDENTLQNPMAHELCHVITENQIARHVHGLVDEGLANYIAATVAPDSDLPPDRPTTHLPLRILARSDVFYDWTQAEEDGGSSWAHYAHAQSLVRYLLSRSDMKTFKAFYRQLSDRADAGDNAGEAMATAVRTHYHLALPQLEQEWRKAATPASPNETSPVP